MPAPLIHVHSSGHKLPASADAVIIGAGIVGTFAAYYLARRGLKVVLLEKGRVGGEQSSRNWGWCRQQNRDARELPIATTSINLWENFATESGEDTGFRRCGLLYLSNEDAELSRWHQWRDFARSVGVTTHMLTGAEATARAHATGRIWKGGVFSPSDGTADPSMAAPAVARALMKLGGGVYQHCAARGIERSAGRVSGVITERGTIQTKAVLLSGGAWASSFCRQFGFSFPQATVRFSIAALAPGAEGLPDALHTADISVTRRNNGGHTLAISGRGRWDPTPQQLRFAPQFAPMMAKRWRFLKPGGLQGVINGHETIKRWALDKPTPMERVRTLDPRPDPVAIRLMHRRAMELLPPLRHTGIDATWAGYIDSTPDGVPAIGELEQVPGLVLAAGFSGHGFGIGPGSGHLAADLLSGADPIVDAVPYDPARFAAGRVKVAEF